VSDENEKVDANVGIEYAQVSIAALESEVSEEAL
jgi:hypothetical protein